MSARRRKAGRTPGPAATKPPATAPLFSGAAAWYTVGLVLATLAVYAPVAQFDFVSWDDPQYILNNPLVGRGLAWPNMLAALSSGYASNWHPLTWWSHMLDVQIYGMNAGGHHVTSLLLHLTATLLLFGFLVRATGAPARSACAAALFAVHPVHVESVAWVSERKDVLSTCFWMLTLLAYLRYVRAPEARRYALVVAAFALGLMAKPMLVTLPFVLLLLDVWPLGRLGHEPVRMRAAQLVGEKAPLMVLSAASCIVTFVVQRRGGAVAAAAALPLTFRVENAAVSYVAYIGKMFWPSGLANVYPYSKVMSLPLATACAVALTVASLAACRAWRRAPYLAVGWFWYLGTLVPVIGLVQVGNQAMADRYTYVPLIGLFIVVAWGVPDLLARWPWRRAALATAAVAALAACLVTARIQVGYWRDSLALWGRALEVTTGNFTAEDSFGAALSAEGRTDEAIGHFTEAIRINPDFPYAHNNLGVELRKQHRVDEAIAQYADAVRLKPDFAEAHNNLGNALAEANRLEEAVTQYADAVRLRPDYADAHNGMAVATGRLGRFAVSRTEFAEVVRLKPLSASAHFNLAVALASEGRIAEAAVEANQALRLEPANQTTQRLLGELTRAR